MRPAPITKKVVTVNALIPALLIVSATSASLARADEVRYVRDWMSVPLHETQASDSAVVHRGLVSGNAVTLLENDEKSGLARVRSADGIEGWIASRYLTNEPTARLQLEKASAEIADLHKQIEQLKNAQPADQRQQTQQLEDLRAANAQLSDELEKLKNAPGPTEQMEALRQRNAALHEQFEQFSATFQQAQKQRDFDMFRNGAIAVLAGALLALVIPRLRPKKRSEWA